MCFVVPTHTCMYMYVIVNQSSTNQNLGMYVHWDKILYVMSVFQISCIQSSEK